MNLGLRFTRYYYDPTIPDDFFRQQLRMRRTTFQMLLNVIAPRITGLDTHLGNYVPPEKLRFSARTIQTGSWYFI